MLSRWLRTWDSVILKPLIALLTAKGATPNMLTVASLAVVAASGALIFLGHTLAAALALLGGGVLDALDGELARHSRRESAFGAYLDSICDHLGDFCIYAGLTWLLIVRGPKTDVLLVLAAQFGSLFGSQVRSRAGMLGIDTKEVGVFTRLERIVTIAVGLGSGWITAALWVLAVGTNLTALQRLRHVVAARREVGEKAAEP